MPLVPLPRVLILRDAAAAPSAAAIARTAATAAHTTQPEPAAAPASSDVVRPRMGVGVVAPRARQPQLGVIFVAIIMPRLVYNSEWWRLLLYALYLFMRTRQAMAAAVAARLTDLARVPAAVDRLAAGGGAHLSSHRRARDASALAAAGPFRLHAGRKGTRHQGPRARSA